MAKQEGRKEAFIYKNPSDYVASGATKQERKDIKEELENKNFMINVTPVDVARIKTLIGSSGMPSEIVWAAIENGMVWANCHVDESSNTYKIEMGKPVCFSMSTGKHVTGLNPDWEEDEYIIIGIAWKNFEGPGTGRIPISLSKQDTRVKVQLVMFRLEEELFHSPSPNVGKAKARIVDPATMLTKPGPVIIVYDDEVKWTGPGLPAPSGDDGGDDRSGSAIGWAAFKNDFTSTGEVESEDDVGLAKFSIVSMGSFFRYISGLMQDGSRGTILAAWDGDFLPPGDTLHSLPCQMPEGECYYYAVWNEVDYQYELFEFCCVSSSSSSSFSSSSSSSSSKSSSPSSSESESSSSFSSSSDDCDWITVLTSASFNRFTCELTTCERQICIEPDRIRPTTC